MPLTNEGKKRIAKAMYMRGRGFLGAAMLLRQKGGYEYPVLYLVCQGIEIVLKSFLLFYDFDKYRPQKLKGKFGHKLEKLTNHVLAVFGLNPLRPPLSEELRALDELYKNQILRYASVTDLIVDQETISSDRVLRRMCAALILAEKHLPD